MVSLTEMAAASEPGAELCGASGVSVGVPYRAWLVRAVLCLSAVSVLMISGNLRFASTWGANDDVTMAAFANGDYSGGVASRLIHIHVAVGQVLAFLYSWLPRVPWYALLMRAGWAVAWSAVLFLVFSGPAHGRAIRVVLAVAAIAIGFPGGTLVVTFTSGAFAIGVAGLLLLAAAATRDRLAAGLAAGLGGAALLCSSLIRWDSFLGIVLAFLPVWAAIALRAGLRRSLVVAAVVGVAAFGLHAVDHAVYTHNDEWRTYDEFRLAHKDLIRGNRLAASDDLTAAIRKVGWQPADAGLLKAFVFADPDVYTTDALRTLRDAVPAQRVSELGDVFRIAVKPYRFFAWTLLAICVVHLVRARRPLTRLWIFGSLVWLSAVLAYLTMYVRFPTRMATPFWASVVIVAAVVPDLLRANELRRRPLMEMAPATRLAIAGATLVALFMVASNAIDRADGLSRHSRALHRLYAEDAATLRSIDPDGVFVGSGGTVTTTGTDPGHAGTAFRDLRYIELGWPTFSPHYQRRLANLGVTNLYESLAFDKGFYFVGREPLANALERFLLRHHGWKVDFTEVATLHRNVSVWTATAPS